MIRLPFVLALLGALGACTAPNGGVRKLPPDIKPEPYQEPPRVEPSVGRLMVQCSQHLQTWQELMAAPRSAENREKIDFTERSLATLVHREAETLRQQVVAGSPRNRGIAAASLGFGGDPHDLDLIANAVADSDPQVSANALLGIAMLSDPDTPFGPIYEKVMDPKADPAVLRNAAFAALRFADKLHEDPNGALSAILIPLLDNHEAEVRAQAAIALGLIRAAHTTPRLVRLLQEDPDPQVRTAAAYSLGEIGSRGTGRALAKALADPDALVGGTARASLVKIFGQDQGPDPSDWVPVVGSS